MPSALAEFYAVKAAVELKRPGNSKTVEVTSEIGGVTAAIRRTRAPWTAVPRAATQHAPIIQPVSITRIRYFA